MVDDDIATYIAQAQSVAHSGRRPHEIVRMLFDSISANHGDMFIIRLEAALRRAFDIPLVIVRDIEPWEGFAKAGTMTNQEIDDLLLPWIQQYLDSHQHV